MHRTYTLTGTCNGGARSIESTGVYWSNFYASSTRGVGFGAADQSTESATNIVFDADTLAMLKTKTIVSAILTLNVYGRVYGQDSEGGRVAYPICYKLNNVSSGDSGSGAWTRANNTTTAAGSYVVAYVARQETGSVVYNWEDFDVDVTAGGIPKYGYSIGPGGQLTHILLGATATLTIVTDEPGGNVKVSGAWKEAEIFTKVSGAWKQARPWIKVNGAWRSS